MKENLEETVLFEVDKSLWKESIKEWHILEKQSKNQQWLVTAFQNSSGYINNESYSWNSLLNILIAQTKSPIQKSVNNDTFNIYFYMAV